MRQQIINEIKDSKAEGNMISYSTKVVIRGKQKFAIFRGIAVDVTRLNYSDLGNGFGFVPVHIDGKYILATPDCDECGEKILCVNIFKDRHNKKIKLMQFLPCRWIYVKELELSNSEINDNIIDELDNGQLNIR